MKKYVLLFSLAISSFTQPLWAASLATLKKDFMYHTKQAYECLITNKNCDAQIKKTYLIGALTLALLAVGIPSSVYLYKHTKPLSPEQIELNKKFISEALWGDTNTLQELLNQGAQINAFHDTTALRRAITNERKEAIKFLLEHGANPNMVDELGTPLLQAIDQGYPDGVRLLLQYGAKVNVKAKYVGTPLMLAASKGYQNIVKMLLDAGANVNLENKDGETALHKALYAKAKKNKIAIVKDLLDAGANPNIKDKDGDFMLDYPLVDKPIRDLLQQYATKTK